MPARARLLDQAIEEAQARLRLLPDAAVRRVTQEPDEAVQLVQGFPAGLAYRRERVARASGISLEQALRRPGLHDHHADAVGDDVVQLARHPVALLGDRAAGDGLLLGLEHGGPLLECPRVQVAAADPLSGQVRDRDEYEPRHDIAPALETGGEQRKFGQHEQPEEYEHDSFAALGRMQARRVDEQQENQERLERKAAVGVVDDVEPDLHGKPEDQQRSHRRAAPPHDRDGHRDDEQRVQKPRPREIRVECRERQFAQPEACQRDAERQISVRLEATDMASGGHDARNATGPTWRVASDRGRICVHPRAEGHLEKLLRQIGEVPTMARCAGALPLVPSVAPQRRGGARCDRR